MINSEYFCVLEFHWTTENLTAFVITPSLPETIHIHSWSYKTSYSVVEFIALPRCTEPREQWPGLFCRDSVRFTRGLGRIGGNARRVPGFGSRRRCNDGTLKRRRLDVAEPRFSKLHPLFVRPCVTVCGARSNGRFVNLYLALYDHWLTWFRWLLPWLRVSVPRCDLKSTYRALRRPPGNPVMQSVMQRTDVSALQRIL